MTTNNEMPRQSAAASSVAQSGEQSCEEAIATHAVVTGDSVAPVSPAISPAVNPESREQLKTETRSEHQSGNQSGNGNTKANCYECKHRGGVPGSAHSSCRHPAFASALEHPLGQLLSIMGRRSGANASFGHPDCVVKGNAHGIRQGWFLHPFNFDPVWLESCTGFEKQPES